MAAREQAVAHVRLHLGRQLDESQGVGHRGPVFADLGGDFLLREVELIDQLRITLGLLDRVKVFALEILDKRQLERRSVVHVADDDRHLGQAGYLRGSPAALPGDELVAALARPHNQRLHDAILADRLGQLVQRGIVKPVARLHCARENFADRYLIGRVAGRG